MILWNYGISNKFLVCHLVFSPDSHHKCSNGFKAPRKWWECASDDEFSLKRWNDWYVPNRQTAMSALSEKTKWPLAGVLGKWHVRRLGPETLHWAPCFPFFFIYLCLLLFSPNPVWRFFSYIILLLVGVLCCLDLCYLMDIKTNASLWFLYTKVTARM